MKKESAPSGSKKNNKPKICGYFQNTPPVWVYILHLALYVPGCVLVNRLAVSTKVLHIGSKLLPVSMFPGVLSSLNNLCLMSLAFFFGKIGFLTALVLLSVQIPVIIVNVAVSGVPSSLPGLFTDLFTIAAILTIYLKNQKVEQYQENLRRQAVTDILTGMPNRFACRELVEELQKNGEKYAAVSIDINNFKSINDTMGLEAGNKVLKLIAECWMKAADSGVSGTRDFIARLGGDEFALIIRDYSSDSEIINTISVYKAELEKKLTVDECDLFLSASFGYAEYPDDTDSYDSLFTYANAAMCEVKRDGIAGGILHFSEEMMKIEHNMEIERKLRSALDSSTIYYNLQPQFDINHKLRGFEALARMKDSDGRIISPGDFIPVAEKTGLIDKVDLEVFRKSAELFGRLVKQTGTDITLSINISVKHLMKNDFLSNIRSILDSSGIPPAQLEIEITESIMIDSAEKALECINSIRALGIKVAIDDFGTGYSSLSYLNKFPADLLKVDKSFIDKMNTSDPSKQYVAAIISIGHIMDFDVIAEGVEEPEQLETLESIGCDFIQGYIWGKPLPPEEAEKLVIGTAAET